jgi:hypothetical protein
LKWQGATELRLRYWLLQVLPVLLVLVLVWVLVWVLVVLLRIRSLWLLQLLELAKRGERTAK